MIRNIRPGRRSRRCASVVGCAIEPLEQRLVFSVLTIAQENQLPGTPQSQWDISGAGDPSIQGFATDISVNEGQTVNFKINDTALAPYRMDIYRMGYYQGNGARLVASIGSNQTRAVSQPSPLTNSSTGLVDCGNWSVTASWAVPTDATSGIYFARVVRDNGGASHIVFIVRNDASHSDILLQTSDSTWQAYNDWGGKSLYDSLSAGGRAFKVSYNRPFNTRSDSPHDWVFNAEYPMVRWLESNGYDVTYFTDVDAARNGALIQNHQVYMSVGHDEYWSGEQRANIQAARDAGVNLAFFSGNESFWKTRWESSIDGSGTSYRTLVCYKETQANAPTDPLDPTTWTGTWADPRFSPPADGGAPQNALTGQLFTVNRGVNDIGSPITVPSTFAGLRFWRNTSVAQLGPGQVATLGDFVLGYEWDEAVDNGFRPAGLITLSSTTQDGAQKFTDFGNTVATASATHSLTLYRAASGALVFGAGTVQWSWGLDGVHDVTPSTPDVNIQQATVNLLADMGAQAATLQAGLVAATASTDTIAPTSTITSPASGSSFQSGSAVTIKGTASDSGGGVVAGVEVSVDGGRTWHPATGTNNWTFTYTPAGGGTINVQSRAIDDSGNIATPKPGITLNIQGPATTTLWTPWTTPANVAPFDPNAVEVGVKFRSDVSGFITGIRFYKGSQNTGTHIGNLWDSNGNLLATATFTNETASGWQQVNFATRVAIQANTVYIASYHTDAGFYAGDNNYFVANTVTSGPLHALAAGTSGGNGVYGYGASAFPSNTYQATNYWVDMVFTSGTQTVTPAVISESPTPNASGVGTNTMVSATFNEPVLSSSIVFNLKNSSGSTVAATVSYNNTTRTVTLTPSSALAAGGTYTATVSGATDSSGNTMTSPFIWSFTTASQSTGNLTIWSSTAVPANASVNDPNAVELGVKFRSDVSGFITGIRFYKGAGNTGTHAGSLWSSSGQLLATATFSSETASGWQQVTFSSPVAIQANTVYVASYHTNTGNYAANNNFFTTSGVDNGSLHALAASTSGGNGVYGYGASAFPSNTYQATNYWVDVVFSSGTQTVTPAVTSQTPANNATGVATGTAVTATFNESVVGSSISFVLKNSNGGTVTASVLYNDATRTATLTPVSALAAGATYTATVSGATDANGNTMAGPFSWSFTTASQSAGNLTIWSTTAVPANASVNDPNAVELGVKFRSDVSGFITGIRFYKGSQNTGTHIGKLWDSNGNLLATATFTNETASGWQQVTFSSPVAIQANTVYVASYHTNTGNYAANNNFFTTSGVDNGSLHALSASAGGGNGVYVYGASAFPGNTYQATNYWVDVVFHT